MPRPVVAGRGNCAAAVALLALMWLVVVRSEEDCEQALPQKQGSSLLQRKARGVLDSLGESLASGRRDDRHHFSASAKYCYESNPAGRGCWAERPGNSTPDCDSSSGKAVCRCPDFYCDMDELSTGPITTGRCAKRLVYVAAGRKHVDKRGRVAATGSGTEVFCVDMIKNDEWVHRHMARRSTDGLETTDHSWWGCWPPNTWKDGKCLARTRYLGETCWDGYFGAGRCKGSALSHEEYATSCYKGVCIPYAWAHERRNCTCAWLGWNVVFACSAAGGACDGHACVVNVDDGKSYCDYASSQSW